MAKTLVIAGGGPGGLTLANLAIRQGFSVVVVERSVSIVKAKNSLGGGIGLWVNSLLALEHIPGAVSRLKACGLFMPNPAYRDASGRVLAAPLADFGLRYPVLSLEREAVLETLLQGLESPVDKLPSVVTCEIRTGVAVESFETHASGGGGGGGGVTCTLSDKSTVQGDVLVACDGIYSSIRSHMLASMDVPRSVPVVHCGYVYFRACLDVPADEPAWHAVSFEAWSQGVRVGYVPLKKPAVFWFLSIPSTPHGEFAPKRGVHGITDQVKAQLLARVAHFSTVKGGVDIARMVEATPTSAIVQTDIFKVPGVQRFPWTAHDGKVILLGDAAHAVPPNLAMGAGISIEDAADLAYLLAKARPIWNAGGLQEAALAYEARRKQRAVVVQGLADCVAVVGQLDNAALIAARNAFMRATRLAVPWLQSRIFERVVALALGQMPFQSTVWEPPPLSAASSLLARTLSSDAFSTLPVHVARFKADPNGGHGHGTVTVKRGNAVARVLATLAGLPAEMTDQRFVAAVVVSRQGQVQTWSRVFGYGTSAAVRYATTHTLARHGGARLLSEGVGGPLDSLVRFGYTVRVSAADKALAFESAGLWVMGFKLPAWLSLKSAWTETPTATGWRYQGEISAPLVGRLMAYGGEFVIETPVPRTGRRALVCGGTGLVGSAVCEQLAMVGFDVVVLSRSRGTTALQGRFPVVRWDGRTKQGWSQLVDAETVIVNLAGENPGAKRWTAAYKRRIEQSRLDAIAAVADAIAEARERGCAPAMLLQASAAGVYGHRGAEALDESAAVGSPSEFRVSCCLAIERDARFAAGDDVQLVLLRIGHVLSQHGGFFPYVDLASRMRASRLGSGEQYVPWVHLDDVARCIAQCASGALGVTASGVLNVAAPVPATNAQLLRAVAEARGRIGCVVPVFDLALRLALGESASVVLDSQRIVPRRLMDAGFQFECRSIDEGVRCLV